MAASVLIIMNRTGYVKPSDNFSYRPVTLSGSLRPVSSPPTQRPVPSLSTLLWLRPAFRASSPFPREVFPDPEGDTVVESIVGRALALPLHKLQKPPLLLQILQLAGRKKRPAFASSYNGVPAIRNREKLMIRSGLVRLKNSAVASAFSSPLPLPAMPVMIWAS